MNNASFTKPVLQNRYLSCFSVCVHIIQIDKSPMLVLKSPIPSVLVVWLAVASDEVKVLSEVVESSTKHQRELIPLIDTCPLLRCWKIRQKYLRQTNSDSRRVLTVGLSAVRGL